MRRRPHDSAGWACRFQFRSSSTEADNATLESCQSTGGIGRLFPTRPQSEIVADQICVWYLSAHRDGMSVLDLVGDDYEIVVKLRRALSHRYPVNRIAV